MPFKQIVRVALMSLKTNKTRSILTMLGVIIGVAAVILLVALGSGLQKYVTDQFESLGANLIMVMPGNVDMKRITSGPPDFATSKLKLEDVTALKTGSDVILNAMPASISQSALKYSDNKVYVQVIGTSEDYPSVINSPVEFGDFFTKEDDRAGRKVVVLGSKVKEDLFADTDPLDEKIAVGDSRFTVIGVLKSKGGFGGSDTDNQVLIPITAFRRLYNQDRVSIIYAQAKNADSVDLAIGDAKTIMERRLEDDEFTVLNSKDIVGAIASILGMLTIALAGIAAISLIVGGIGIMNIMLVSVTERTKEIGLRKALGATPQVILTQFLTEAVILSVGGGLIGIILGSAGAFAISRVAPVEITPWAVLLAFSVSAGVGIIFGVAPARRASKLSPIEALRYE